MGSDTVGESQEGFSEKVAYKPNMKKAGAPSGVLVEDTSPRGGSTIRRDHQFQKNY